MPYHYEFTKGSDDVKVTLHPQMSPLKSTSQVSLAKMYNNDIDNLTQQASQQTANHIQE